MRRSTGSSTFRQSLMRRACAARDAIRMNISRGRLETAPKEAKRSSRLSTAALLGRTLPPPPVKLAWDRRPSNWVPQRTRRTLADDLRHILSVAAARALGAAAARPLSFAVLCGALKDGSCDYLVQRQSSPLPWDWRRTAIFTVFGGCFVGAWQYALFSVALPAFGPAVPSGFATAGLLAKLRDTAGLRAIAVFVIVENCFNQPLLYFPTLYSIKHQMEHTHHTLSQSIVAGVRKARLLFVEDNIASLRVWVPATLINGLFMPLWARIPFMTLCGCGFTCFVSLTRGAPDPDADLASDAAKAGSARLRRLRTTLTGI
jgi:hypothetical protein